MTQQMLADAAYDHETTASLNSAFDQAWDALKGRYKTDARGIEIAQMRLASHLLMLAGWGERDTNRLRDQALCEMTSIHGPANGVAWAA